MSLSLVLALLLRIFVNPLANVFQKKMTDGGFDPLILSFSTYLFLSLAGIPYALFVDWTRLTPSFWCYAAIVGLLGALGNGFLVLAMKYGELSVLGPINAYKSVVGILVGAMLLAEIPNLAACLGVMLIIGGSYYVLDGTGERFSWRLLRRADVKYRLLAMIFGAVEAVFIKKVIQLSTPELSLLTWCWFGAIFSLPFLFRKSRATSVRIPRSLYRWLPGVVFCVGAMQLSTNYAFDRMPVGYALALFQLSAIVSVFFGYHFFRERNIVQKFCGSLIMVSGSVLIILFRGRT